MRSERQGSDVWKEFILLQLSKDGMFFQQLLTVQAVLFIHSHPKLALTFKPITYTFICLNSFSLSQTSSKDSHKPLPTERSFHYHCIDLSRQFLLDFVKLLVHHLQYKCLLLLLLVVLPGWICDRAAKAILNCYRGRPYYRFMVDKILNKRGQHSFHSPILWELHTWPWWSGSSRLSAGLVIIFNAVIGLYLNNMGTLT